MKKIRQMRNSLGVLNIYFKAIWMPLLFFLLPLGVAIFATWAALFWNGWIAVGFAIFLWLCAGFLIWVLEEQVRDVWRDAFGKRTTLRGSVSRKWVTERTERSTTFKDYEIAVSYQSFEVSKKIYNWLAKGDTVVVHYWPRSKTVARIEKVSVQDLSTPSLVPQKAVVEASATRSYEEHMNLGLDHGGVGEWAEAEAEFRAALKLRPNSAVALGNLGMVYLQLEEYDEAVQHLLGANDIGPSNDSFLVWLAEAYPHSSSFTDHAEKIRSLLERAGERSEAYRLLNLTYWLCCVKRGETTTALDSMRDYIDDPQTKGKRYARKLLAALEQGTDKFMGVSKIE